MNIVNFDTRQFIRDMHAEEIQPEPAKGVGDVLKDVIDVTEVATKSDIERLELRIKAEMSIIKLMIGAIAAGVITLVLRSFF
jgi:hypothetical protein